MTTAPRNKNLERVMKINGDDLNITKTLAPNPSIVTSTPNENKIQTKRSSPEPSNIPSPPVREIAEKLEQGLKERTETLSKKLSQKSETEQAKQYVKEAKTLLGTAKNLKTEIKTGTIEYLNLLLQIVTKLAENRGTKGKCEGESDETKMVVRNPKEDQRSQEIQERQEKLIKALNDHKNKMQEHVHLMSALQNVMESAPLIPQENGNQDDNKELAKEVSELKEITLGVSEQITRMRENAPSYAEILSRPQQVDSTRSKPKHSVIVTTGIDTPTHEDTLKRVSDTLRANENGHQIEGVRKIRNGKIVISCASKAEIQRATDRLRTNKDLKVEEAVNKNPLVVIKNLMSYQDFGDIERAVQNQNRNLLEGLTAEEMRMEERYRRRARNPLEAHVVLRVTPQLWQRMTAAGKLFIGIQHVRVEDQSPLLQCSKCLGYGHGRKNCSEKEDLCHYCGEEHLRAQCPKIEAGQPPNCINCKKAKHLDAEHAAYSSQCVIRRKWDEISRTNIAYC